MAPETALVGSVYVDRRKTKKGETLYLRWRERRNGRVCCCRQGTGLRIPKGTRSRERRATIARAEIKAADKAAELGDASAGPTPSSLRNHVRMRRIRDSVAWYLAEMEGQRAATTLAPRARVLDAFVLWATTQTAKGPAWRREPIARPSQLSNGDLAAWASLQAKRTTRHGRAPAPSYLVVEYGHLDAFLAWCWERGLTHEHLTMKRHIQAQQFRARRGTPERPKKEPVSLEDDEVRAILDRASTPRRRTVLRFMAATGLRNGEVVGALTANWDREKATLTVVGKGYKERTIPLGPRTNASLIELRTHHFEDEERLVPWLGMGAIGGWLRKEPITPHNLRAWFNTTLMRQNCPVHIRELLMGHAIPRTDAAYMLAHAYRVSDGRPWVEKVEDVLDGNL